MYFSQSFFALQIFYAFFIYSTDRDLFENGHTIFIRSKLDFIQVFEKYAVLKTYGPVWEKSDPPHISSTMIAWMIDDGPVEMDDDGA